MKQKKQSAKNMTPSQKENEKSKDAARSERKKKVEAPKPRKNQ